jgi:hypothetical protein
MPGQAVVLMSRLLNSRPVHEALEAAPEANLAVVLSTRIYEDVVLQEHTLLTAKDFRRVHVKEKELETDAWLRVPGADIHRLDLPSNTRKAQQATAAEQSNVVQVGDKLVQGNDRAGAVFTQHGGVSNTFHERVDATHANFGQLRGRDEDV